jgi:dolichyl-phosphate beta-glucosyltransferase
MQKISLIIPCYNEEGRLPVRAILDYLSCHPAISVLLVNDGSRDKTGPYIDSVAAQNSSQITVLHLPHNQGKAEAVRQGMLKMVALKQDAWLGFWDADLATPLDHIDHLLAYAGEPVKMILCSRIRRLGARVQRHLWRHLGGRIMATWISLVLKLPVYDTQCGAKLIRREVIEPIFSKPFLSKWLLKYCFECGSSIPTWPVTIR